MILIYLVLEQDQFTEYDAHYFPEASIPISRLSEPKNYSASTEPKGLPLELRIVSEQANWELDSRGDPPFKFQEKIREGGCEAYISKPISVVNFLETVEKFLA